MAVTLFPSEQYHSMFYHVPCKTTFIRWHTPSSLHRDGFLLSLTVSLISELYHLFWFLIAYMDFTWTILAIGNLFEGILCGTIIYTVLAIKLFAYMYSYWQQILRTTEQAKLIASGRKKISCMIELHPDLTMTACL